MSESARPPADMEGDPGWLLKVIKDQRLAFLVVGGANTVVGFFWFWTLNEVFAPILDPRWGYLVTLTVSYIISTFCAFVMYRFIVFRVRGHFGRDLVRFYTLYLTGLGMNYVLLPIVHKGFGVALLPAQFIVLSVWVVISWFGQKYFAFRRSVRTP